MGELLVEIMRPRANMPLGEAGEFLGPFPSGAPGIFIDTVARLGHAAGIVSGVGDDAFGRAIVDRLRCDGVCTELVGVYPGRATGVAFVTYRTDGSREFNFHFDGTPAVMARAPEIQRLNGARFFHVMGCSLMANDRFRSQILAAAELAASAGARITFDPNIRGELLHGRSIEEVAGIALTRCSILFPGEGELRLLGGGMPDDQAVAGLFDRYPLDHVVVKRGSRGCSVFSHDERVDVPPFRVHEADPTGAGDCFDAGFLCGLLEGRGPVESARIGAAVGAINARTFGPMEGRISRGSVSAPLRGQPASQGVV
jgi:sugar/nucleoside kinase (ribokinase family)